MKKILLGVLIGVAVATIGFRLLSVQEPKVFDSSTLPHYSLSFDKEANASADLTKAMHQATQKEQNILLIAGGDWCRWCGTMENFLEANPKVAESLYGQFEVLRVYYGKGMNPTAKALLRAYPKPKGTPHFFVLDSQAKLLLSFHTGELERGYGYNRKKFEAFIEKYAKLKTITKDKK